MVIIANPEFHLSAQASLDLSFEQRCLFLPFIEPAAPKRANRKVSEAKKIVNLRLYEHIMTESSEGTRGISQGMCNFLKAAQKSRLLSKERYSPVDYTDVLYKSFFSPLYKGHERPGAHRLKIKTAPKLLVETVAAVDVNLSMKDKLKEKTRNSKPFNQTNLGSSLL